MRQTTKIALICLATVIIIRVFFIDTFAVSGDSMAPSINDGDYVVVNRLAYLFTEPGRGDIVVARPRGTMFKIIKRIVGLPGELVRFEKDKIVVKENRADSGKILSEFYLRGDTTRGNQEAFSEIIDPAEYYVLGDNRDISIDSRRLGGVDRWGIEGKVIYSFHF